VVGRKQVDTKSQEAAFFATHYPFAVVKKLFAIKDTELQNDPIEFIPLECYPAAANLINTWSIIDDRSSFAFIWEVKSMIFVLKKICKDMHDKPDKPKYFANEFRFAIIYCVAVIFPDSTPQAVLDYANGMVQNLWKFVKSLDYGPVAYPYRFSWDVVDRVLTELNDVVKEHL